MAPPEYMTIGKVAEFLGIARWRLSYLIERGDIPGPSVLVPGRRLFTQGDAELIRNALEERARRRAGDDKRTF